MRRTGLAIVVLALAGCGGGAPAPAAAGLDDAGAVARIEVPGAGIDVVAVDDPGGAAVHVAGSATPCAEGVAVVAAGEPFGGLLDTPVDGVVAITRPGGATCSYDVVQVAPVAAEDFDPAAAGRGRDAALVLVAPGAEDGVRNVVVADLDPSSTTTTAPPSPTTEPVVVTPQPTGRAAVDALLAAWRAGDRRAARAVAEPDAVDALFAVPVEPTEDRGCSQPGANEAVQCVFRLPSGELQVRAVDAGGGFVVDFALLSAA